MKFFTNNKAVVAVEFALIAPIFIFLICISLESFRIQVARCLIERSIYDLAYRTKVDQNREQNFETLKKEVIEKRNYGFFQVNEVDIVSFHSPTFEGIVYNPPEGPGGGNDIVMLQFTTSFGLFRNIFFINLKTMNKEVFKYYYINEAAGQVQS